MRAKLRKQGYDKETVDLILDAWRPSTKKVYTTYLRKWAVFCVSTGVRLMSPTLAQACRFLKNLEREGLGYGAVNAARSALSAILPHFEGCQFGRHPTVSWLLKGVYHRKPPQARYTCFWNVTKVFQLLKSWGRNRELTLKLLTMKLVVLLLLVTSQRGQTILALSLDGLGLSEQAVFRLKVLLKHNRLGDRLDTLVLKPYHHSARLCVVRTLKEYVQRTEKIRGNVKQLVISFMRPHKAVSRDTLARWTLSVLAKAGIDTEKYKSHSMRGASTSAAHRLGLSVNQIMRQAGWHSVESFSRFYNKDLEKDVSNVGHALLDMA